MTGLVATTPPGTLVGFGSTIHSTLDGGANGRRPRERYRVDLTVGQQIEVDVDCPDNCVARVLVPTASQFVDGFFAEISPPSGVFTATIAGSHQIEVQAFDRNVRYTISIKTLS